MKRHFCTLFVLSVAGLAFGQTPVPPFPPSFPIVQHVENFDSFAPGVHPFVSGFGSTGTVAPFPSGLVFIDNSILTGLSLPNSCWGRGNDIEIRWTSNRRFFGGWFRVPSAGIAVSAMIVRFYQGIVPVGTAIAGVNMTSWLWRGWFVGAGFNRVTIHGNVAPPTGYVGMDNLRTRI